MAGTHIALIIEEEFIIALEVQRVLETLGIDHIVFARNHREAEGLVPDWRDLALAVLDLGIASETTVGLAHDLRRAGVPVVLTTADSGLRDGVDGLDVRPLLKPVAEDELAAAVRQVMADRGR